MEKQVSEGSLHKWFKGSKSKDGKGGWVNVVTGGTCASDKPGEGTPKCVSSSKRASMTKAERLSAARRKKKADPGQQQKSGAAKPTYVSTDKKKKKMKESYSRSLSPLSEKAQKCWKGYEKKGTKKMFGKTYNNCVKKEEVEIVDEAMSSYDKNRKAAAKRAADRNAARRRGELGGRMENETYRNEAGTRMHHKGYKAEEVKPMTSVTGDGSPLSPRHSAGGDLSQYNKDGTKKTPSMNKKRGTAFKGVREANEEVEIVDEAKVDQGKDDAAKKNTRNQRTFGNRRNTKKSDQNLDDTEARRYNTEKDRGVKMRGKKDKRPTDYAARDLGTPYATPGIVRRDEVVTELNRF